VTYTFHLETGEAGSYPLDPIEIRFTPRGRSASLYTRLTGPTLVVTAAPARWPWIAGGVVAAGIGLAVASARRRRG
jgi:hypothetical protein